MVNSELVLDGGGHAGDFKKELLLPDDYSSVKLC